jgi:hypothetical protein
MPTQPLAAISLCSSLARGPCRPSPESSSSARTASVTCSAIKRRTSCPSASFSGLNPKSMVHLAARHYLGTCRPSPGHPDAGGGRRFHSALTLGACQGERPALNPPPIMSPRGSGACHGLCSPETQGLATTSGGEDAEAGPPSARLRPQWRGFCVSEGQGLLAALRATLVQTPFPSPGSPTGYGGLFARASSRCRAISSTP